MVSSVINQIWDQLIPATVKKLTSYLQIRLSLVSLCEYSRMRMRTGGPSTPGAWSAHLNLLRFLSVI